MTLSNDEEYEVTQQLDYILKTDLIKEEDKQEEILDVFKKASTRALIRM